MGAIYQGADSCEDCAKAVISAAVSQSNKARIVHGGGVREGGDPYLKKANRCWISIKQRCFNDQSTTFDGYGGRGITMCLEWRDDFPRFLVDVGLPPSLRHSLDRIDVNGNYEPGNVRWVTSWEQSNNRRDTLRVEQEGRTQSLAEWAAELQLPYHVLYQRYKRGERPPELFRI
ncbi:hypothetical protein D3C86_1690830 [compost metagenome]